MNYIPDPVELMNSRIEDNIDKAFSGVKPGYFKCAGCNEIFPENDVHAFTANPDSPAGCSKCTGFDQSYRITT